MASRSAAERGFDERVALKTRDVFVVMEGVRGLNMVVDYSHARLGCSGRRASPA